MANELPNREAMEFDVVIVGAGPAGLAAAIRLKQIVARDSRGGGGEGLRGRRPYPVRRGDRSDRARPAAAGMARARTRRSRPRSATTASTGWDQSGALRLPNFLMPPLMSNHGNFIVSLGNVCRWLATKAEALGVEIYPGFAAAEVLYRGRRGRRRRHRRHGHRQGRRAARTSFTRGMELRAKYTLFAEGARGSLSKPLIAHFGLDRGREPQKFGIGLKELWQVAPDQHRPGLVQHSFGWPLDNSTGGGSFLYHFDDNLVSVGFVVHLNYANPYLSPFEEFQRFKTHPLIRDTFEGGKRLSLWRARHHRRRLAVGAEAVVPGRRADRLRGRLRQRAAHQGQPQRDAVRHAGGRACRGGACGGPRQRRARRATTRPGATATSAATCGRCATPSRCGRSSAPFSASRSAASTCGPTRSASRCSARCGHGKPDSATLKPASECRPIAYPKPDGKLTFDRLSSVFLSNTNHEEDQPVHLHVADLALQKASEHDVYAGPSARYCPAGVYEWVEEGGQPRFVINAQNCVHCKTCDIKDPNRNITWVPPEGGGGPNYPNM